LKAASILWTRALSAAELFKRVELIMGDSVRAITPDTITAAASVNANSRNSVPAGRQETDGGVNRGQM